MSGQAHEIVSDESESLILVDRDDNELGTLSKARCHDGDGVLHRAFSLFIFDRAGRLLLQRRARDKRLWPGYWSNSCCSHPRAGEEMEEAVQRRLAQELGISAALDFVYKFTYQASYGDAGSEHELCWVYAGVTGQAVQANDTEVAEWRYVDPASLSRRLRQRPDEYTPWFRMEWARLTGEYAGRLAAILDGTVQPT
ncbi:MAG: isopentenyl-diphosphate Delta-isomerase [Gammaproteobacteria bacterium]|jgi:isopentenyl-diphosphate delta-isomerase